MFEDVSERWKTYLRMVAPTWDATDPRNGLGAEVRIRLEQLDLIIKKLGEALDIVKPHPDEVEHDLALYLKVRNGEINDDEFEAALLARPFDLARAGARVEAWKLITLLTESFYFVGWRLRQVLSRNHAPLQFPGVGKVEAKEIRLVRNHLIEHPEDHDQNYLQGTIVTDSGPVLRTSTVVMSGSTGKTRPADESKDRGLFENAATFRDELLRRLDRAIAQVASTS